MGGLTWRFLQDRVISRFGEVWVFASQPPCEAAFLLYSGWATAPRGNSISPQGLKPAVYLAGRGTAEAVPFQTAS